MSHKNYKKWKVFSSIVALIIVIDAFIWALSGIITYPTQQHRAVATEMTKLTNQTLASPSAASSIYDSEAYKKQENSPENQYSSMASVITTIVAILVWAWLIVLSYKFIRKRRLVKNYASTTALLFAISSLVSTTITFFAANVFYPAETGLLPGIEPSVQLIITLPAGFVIAYLMAYIVARIVQWRYNKKFGFVEE